MPDGTTEASADNIERLAEDSEAACQDLTRAASTILDGSLPDDERFYLVFSIDLRTASYYSAATNIPSDAFSFLSAAPQATALEVIRDLFPMHRGEGLVGELCRTASELATSPPSEAVVVLLDLKAQILDVTAFDGSPQPQYLERITNSTAGLEPSRDLLAAVTAVSERVDMQTARLAFIPRPRIASPAQSRTFELVQICLLLDSVTSVSSPQCIEYVVHLTNVVHFATLALLAERERYYQKSLRQATRGTLIKSGVHDEIEEQIRLLETLNATGAYSTPRVVKQDINRESGFGWYIMPYFTLPSMMDTLTSVRSLRPFEISGLARACVSHLRHTYWRSVAAQRVEAREFLLSTLALLEQRASGSYRAIQSRAADVMNARPVVGRGGVAIYDPSEIERDLPIIKRVEEGVSLRAEWGASHEPVETVCEGTGEVLEHLRSMLLEIGRGVRIDQYLAREPIHGDPHLGNLLVDASVPEDPVIASIDPKRISVNSDDLWQSYGCSRLAQQPFCSSLDNLRYDVTYDAAKLLVSTVAGYSLVYRRGVRARMEGEMVVLHHPPDRELRKLSEAGGISGSQLVRIDAPVVEEALDYHRLFAELIVQRFIALAGISETEVGSASLLAGLLRLWMITVRHAFSLSEILFPVDTGRSAAMYAVAAALLNRGFPQASEIVRSGFACPAEPMREVLTKGFWPLPIEPAIADQLELTIDAR